MTEAELLARMPLADNISVTSAVEILGGGADRVRELLYLIGIGNIRCRSHARAAGSTRAVPRLGIVEAIPILTPETDPATVLIESDDVLWRWCVDVEEALHPAKGLPPKEIVEARFDSLKIRSVERILGRASTDTTPPAPGTNSASNAPVVEHKAKRRTWWDVSSAYIVEEMLAGQYATAKELYRALEAKAGPNAPFDKGTGGSRGSLFVREIAQPLSLKTVQNNWSALRELAKK